MTPDLQTALYGASAVGFLSILAGVIRQAMWNRNDFKLARNEARSSFLQSQISELYSPLLGLLIESNTYYETLQRITVQLSIDEKHDERTGENPLNDQMLAITAIEARFNHDHFEPLRVKVIDLLCAKRHLIEEDLFPAYLQEFIVHATEYEAKQTVVSELGAQVKLDGLNEAKWPREIIPEVESTLYQLRREYRSQLRLAGRMG